jgi:hypothetical protein
MTHTYEETQEHFKLTRGELKSIFTVGYRDPKLAHLRKDTRRKDSWSVEEMLFAIRHAGIRERNWIAMKLKRGNSGVVIKEKFQKWNASTKHLHGMPLNWALSLWPHAEFSNKIRTKAGPSGNEGVWRFQLIPWADCLKYSRTYSTPPAIRSGIRAMLRFQQFIFRTQSPSVIRRKINQSLKG